MVIDIHRSATLTVALVVAHAGAAAGLMASGLPVWAWLPATAGLCGSCYYVVLVYGLRRHPGAIAALELTDDLIAVSMHTDSEQFIDCQLLDSYISPWAVVLVLRDRSSGRRHSLPILRDACDADDFRRLRAQLLGRAASWQAG